MINLLFFGRLGDYAVSAPKSVQVFDKATPLSIREKLAADYPDLAKQLAEPQVLVSVNKQLVDWQQPLSAGDELAFLPPVTGG